MRRVVLVAIMIASVAFGYNTLIGNRGTFGVYSAKCEDMGMLTINVNAFGTMMNIDSIVPPDTTQTSAQLTEILPHVGLSFTPWHYLEFSLWSRGRYATFGSYNSAMSELYSDLGFSIKGGVPIYFNEAKDAYFAPGIDGFAYMDSIGTNAFAFGGRGLLTFNYDWFGFHLNGGYKYVTLPAGGEVLSGVGLEVWPFEWAGIIVDGTADVPDNDFANFTNYLQLTPGLRFGLGGRVVKFNFNLGVRLEPMQTPLRWHGLAGFGLGFDLMPPTEGFVNGIVVDKVTGEPIEGAEVSIQGRSDIKPSITGKDGRFSISQPDEEFYLLAQHPDYLATRTSSELIAAEEGIVKLELSPKTGGAVVLGTIINAVSGEPVAAVLSFESITSDSVLPAFKADPVSGYYRAVVPPGTYRVQVEAKGYNKTHKSMKLDEADEIVVDFKLEPKPEKEEKIPPPPIAFRSIYFGRGQTSLDSEDYTALRDAVKILNKYPDMKVTLKGYTDSVGDAVTNQKISVRRAQSVQRYLVGQGISAARIKVVGYGETNPRGDNRTRSGRDMNRRVDIVAQ